jgi:LacI family gluconate utilization system Gnt-I transcriptional repressor
MGDKPPRLTVSDVARQAGVGASTVSRVLRNKGAVSAAARQRVEAAVAQLGYVPNRIAGLLASEGSTLVAIIVPSLANNVFPKILAGANLALEAAGFQSVVGVSEYDLEREESLIRALLAWRPAGIVVVGLEHTERATALLKGSGVRVVEVMDLDGDGIDVVVGFSSRAVGRASALHLIGRGYRRIGYVGHAIGRDLRAGKRLAGFVETLSAHGLALVDREVVNALSSIEAGRDGLARLRARSSDLDAVYFSNDDMALGGYFHCLAQGVAIPGRLALFGFNGLEAGRCAPQPLATIKTPRFLIGETAGKLVCSDSGLQRVDVGFELIEGATA